MNWNLSVKIEALKPPYRVYNKEEKITIEALIHKCLPERYLINKDKTLTTAIKKIVM